MKGKSPNPLCSLSHSLCMSQRSYPQMLTPSYTGQPWTELRHLHDPSFYSQIKSGFVEDTQPHGQLQCSPRMLLCPDLGKGEKNTFGKSWVLPLGAAPGGTLIWFSLRNINFTVREKRNSLVNKRRKVNFCSYVTGDMRLKAEIRKTHWGRRKWYLGVSQHQPNVTKHFQWRKFQPTSWRKWPFQLVLNGRN